jgi:hypothetical protein
MAKLEKIQKNGLTTIPRGSRLKSPTWNSRYPIQILDKIVWSLEKSKVGEFRFIFKPKVSVANLFNINAWYLVSDPYGLTGSVHVAPSWGADGFDPTTPVV